MRGNCYVTSEALYHLLGGKNAGWKPMMIRMEADTHWFLINIKTGQRVDATATQFGDELPPYHKAKGCGFLTKTPSKKAKALMEKLVWQE